LKTTDPNHTKPLKVLKVNRSNDRMRVIIQNRRVNLMNMTKSW